MPTKLTPGVNDLQTIAPRIAEEWLEESNGIPPSAVHGHTNKKYWFLCPKCKNPYLSRVNNRVTHGRGCPYCAGQKVLHGMNDLATKYPEVAACWDNERNFPLTASDVTYGSGKRVWWKCPTCGYLYQREINVRIRYNSCPKCHPTSVIKGTNDLATVAPYLALEWSSENVLTPAEISANTHTKYKWICPDCGSTYTASPHHRMQGTGCPYCKRSSGEQAVKRILDEFKLTYKEQATFPDCKYKQLLRFDFVVYDNNAPVCAIEYDGLQHYQNIPFYDNGTNEYLLKTKRRDMIKTIWCISHGIPILRIGNCQFETLRVQVIHCLTNIMPHLMTPDIFADLVRESKNGLFEGMSYDEWASHYNKSQSIA